ncbi:hypothetical protein [Catellatospora citrea]|uniref:Uncharacterized protein n=1 Tax=Catellatospora citrea TaxID=53366 RepID=A0A8J3KBG0_9ACTN|nr:hypothetical protein [Catellatospora citrea]RKE05538.1 hypothetical protein C8E86_0340 [Catellatospora citrea]GIF96886.1 hypothetical protein Cci01nite_19800 [Catellatospora citrea]
MPENDIVVDEKADHASALERLPHLIDRMAQLGIRLDRAKVSDRSWERTLNTLRVVQALRRFTLVTVTGSQGAGKTTLARALYPDAARYLRPNSGRGERVPVVIVESAGIGATRASVVRMRQGSTGQPEIVEVETSSAEWLGYLRGADSDVLHLLVEVPAAEDSANGQGILLLPGFERSNDDEWQRLTRVAVAISPNVIVVTGKIFLANAMEADIARALAEGEAAGTTVVLNRCAVNEPEFAQLREAAADTYAVGTEGVLSMEGNGIGSVSQALRATLSQQATSEMAATRAAQFVRQVVIDDVDAMIKLAVNVHHEAIGQVQGGHALEGVMSEFTEQKELLLAAVDLTLRTALNSHLNKVRPQLDGRLRETFGSEAWKRIRETVSLGAPGGRSRLVSLAAESFNAGEVARIRSKVLESVARDRRFALAAIDLEVVRRTLLDLVNGVVGQGLTHAAQALPFMAIEAHVLARNIDSERSGDGGTGVTAAAGDDQLLGAAAFMMLVPESPPQPTAVNPAATIMTMQTLMTVSRAGRAAGAIGPALLATLIFELGSVVVRENKWTLWEREHLAHNLLLSYRDAVLETTRESVEHLLRITGDMFRSHSAKAMGVNEAQEEQIALGAATQGASIARRRMLEAAW